MKEYKLSGFIKVVSIEEYYKESFPNNYRDYFIIIDANRDREFLINPTIKYFIDKFLHPKTFTEAFAEVEKDVNGKAIKLKQTCKSFFNFLCKGGFIVPHDKVEVVKPSSPVFKAGDRVDQYIISKLLSERHYTEIYLATDNLNGETVVIKLLSRTKTGDKVTYKQELHELEREFHLLKDAHHIDGVCTAFQYNDKSKSYVYIALEYIAGISLWRYIEQEKGLTTHDCLDMLKQLVTAFSRLHQCNIIHGDIHGSNVLITADKAVKIIDLGLSRRADVEEKQLVSFGGVDYYMPPERINATTIDKHLKEPDFYSDVYQIGLLMYLVVYNKLPFDGFIWEQLAVNIKESIPDFNQLTYFNCPLPDGLSKIIQKCIAKVPTERYKNASDILEDFAANVLKKNLQPAT